MLLLRLKRPAQPLVFRFSGAGPLCGAAIALYEVFPGLESSLCLYRRAYYLKVGASLLQRPKVRRAASPYGRYVGACPVLYAYYAEHGRSLSTNAVEELGVVLRGK